MLHTLELRHGRAQRSDLEPLPGDEGEQDLADQMAILAVIADTLKRAAGI